MIKIVKAVQTSFASPSQWDAWDRDGNYVYLRYRYGAGTVEVHADQDAFWGAAPGEGIVASFEHGGDLDGCISLTEFCRLAGLRLADDVEYTGFNEYFSGALKDAIAEVKSRGEV